VSAKKDAKIELETVKGKKLELSPGRYEVTGRGGKGREMSKKDKVKTVHSPIEWVPLPEPKAEKPEKKGD
jgi:DNA gyrase subunit A